MDNRKEEMKNIEKGIEDKIDLRIIMEYEKRVENGEVEFLSIEEVKEFLWLEDE